MKFTLNTACCAAVLALSCAGLAQAQALIQNDLVEVPLNQSFVGAGSTALFATAGDNELSKRVESSSSISFDGFDVARGVLVGASFSLGVLTNDALQLRTWVPETGNHDISADLRASWSILGGNPLAPVINVATNRSLISYLRPHDAGGYASTTSWTNTPLATTASAEQLNSLIGGKDALTSQLSSSIELVRVGVTRTQDANGTLQAFLTNASAQTGAAVDGSLSGLATYRYLAHASASVLFDQQAIERASLSGVNSSTAITIVAGGSDGMTTGLDFSGLAADVSCVGDCGKFSAQLFGADQATGNVTRYSLAAGDETTFGSITLLEDGAFSATYTVTLHDAAAIGASDSQRSHLMSFTVDSGAVSAVSEPKSMALMLAGLGAFGWLSQRRRPAGARVDLR